MSKRAKKPGFVLYIDDFMRGTQSMTAAEVGDYIRLLCVIYDQNGPLKNDAYALRHPLGCTRLRDVKTKIRRLIDLGKLSVDKEGFIHNGRADLELAGHVETPLQGHDTPSTQAKKSTKSRGRARAFRKPSQTSPNGDVTRAGARGPQPDLGEYLKNELSKLQHRKNGHAEPYPTVAGYLDAGDRRGEDPGADPAGQTAGPNAH